MRSASVLLPCCGRHRPAGLAAAPLTRRVAAAGATRGVGEHGFDRRAGAFERRGEARDLGGDVVDALAQQRVLDALGRPGRLRPRASWSAISRCSLARSSIAAASCASSCGDVGAEIVGRRRAAAAGGRQFIAQIGFDLARGFELAAHPVELDIRARPGGGPDRRGGVSSSCTRRLRQFGFGRSAPRAAARDRRCARPRSSSLPRASVNSPARLRPRCARASRPLFGRP